MVSIDREQLAADSLSNLRSDLSVLGLMLLAGLLGAWWIGRRSIVTPAREILAMVQRLQHGQLDARVPLHERWRGSEFTRIAGAFNLMADSLQIRERDLEAELGRSQRAYEVLDQVLNSMPDGLLAVTGRVTC